MPTSLPGSWERGWLNLTWISEPRDQSGPGSYHLQCFVPLSTGRNLSKKWKHEYWAQVQPILKRWQENEWVIVKHTFGTWQCKQLSFKKKTCEGGQSTNTGPARKPIKFGQMISGWFEITRLSEGLHVLAKCKSCYNDHDFISIAKWTPVHIAEPLVFTALAMSQMSRKMSVLQPVVFYYVHILKSSFYKLWIEITAVGSLALNAIR